MSTDEEERLASWHCYEIYRDRSRSEAEREAAAETLFLLRHGFWQRENDGREETFAGFATKIARWVIAYAVGKGARPAALDERDVAQEVLLLFLRLAHRIRTNPGAWMVSAAINRVKSQLREEASYLNAIRLDDAKGVAAPEADEGDSERRAALKQELEKKIARLPPTTGRTMKAMLERPQTAAELARTEKTTAAVIRKRIQRGNEALGVPRTKRRR